MYNVTYQRESVVYWGGAWHAELPSVEQLVQFVSEFPQLVGYFYHAD